MGAYAGRNIPELSVKAFLDIATFIRDGFIGSESSTECACIMQQNLAGPTARLLCLSGMHWRLRDDKPCRITVSASRNGTLPTKRHPQVPLSRVGEAIYTLDCQPSPRRASNMSYAGISEACIRRNRLRDITAIIHNPVFHAVHCLYHARRVNYLQISS